MCIHLPVAAAADVSTGFLSVGGTSGSVRVWTSDRSPLSRRTENTVELREAETPPLRRR